MVSIWSQDDQIWDLKISNLTPKIGTFSRKKRIFCSQFWSPSGKLGSLEAQL